jgi:hypothetical protein
MRSMIAPLRFLPDGSGLKICLLGSPRAIARMVPDAVYPGMWRVGGPGGRLLNRTRAKDVLWGIAENELRYLDFEAAE